MCARCIVEAIPVYVTFVIVRYIDDIE